MKKENYELLLRQLEALLEGQKYSLTLLSNVSALLNEALEDVNWVGFYLWQDEQLILGPFQGKVACQIIEKGKGVCGYTAANEKTTLVEDVHQFAGHIACDSASNSEIVVPLMVNGQLYGVLDIDSPLIARFDETDREYLEKAGALMASALEKTIQNITF